MKNESEICCPRTPAYEPPSIGQIEIVTERGFTVSPADYSSDVDDWEDDGTVSIEFY